MCYLCAHTADAKQAVNAVRLAAAASAGGGAGDSLTSAAKPDIASSQPSAANSVAQSSDAPPSTAPATSAAPAAATESATAPPALSSQAAEAGSAAASPKSVGDWLLSQKGPSLTPLLDTYGEATNRKSSMKLAPVQLVTLKSSVAHARLPHRAFLVRLLVRTDRNGGRHNECLLAAISEQREGDLRVELYGPEPLAVVTAVVDEPPTAQQLDAIDVARTEWEREFKATAAAAAAAAHPPHHQADEQLALSMSAPPRRRRAPAAPTPAPSTAAPARRRRASAPRLPPAMTKAKRSKKRRAAAPAGDDEGQTADEKEEEPKPHASRRATKAHSGGGAPAPKRQKPNVDAPVGAESAAMLDDSQITPAAAAAMLPSLLRRAMSANLPSAPTAAAATAVAAADAAPSQYRIPQPPTGTMGDLLALLRHPAVPAAAPQAPVAVDFPNPATAILQQLADFRHRQEERQRHAREEEEHAAQMDMIATVSSVAVQVALSTQQPPRH